MDIKLNTPWPVPQPEPTITLELSLLEANVIRAALGSGYGSPPGLYRGLSEVLARAGVSKNLVGDFRVRREGPLEPYRY